MSPKTVDKEKKRRKILKATIKVFSDRGISGFKMIDVAKAAGIGKGTIYEYFASKEELIAGCFMAFMEDYGNFLVLELKKESDPKKQIMNFFGVSLRYFAKHQKEMSIIFDFWAAAVPRKHGSPLVPGIEKAYAEFKKYVSAILDDGIGQGLFRKHDTETIALMILGLIDSLMFQAVLGIIDITDKTLPDKISNTILKGISNE